MRRGFFCDKFNSIISSLFTISHQELQNDYMHSDMHILILINYTIVCLETVKLICCCKQSMNSFRHVYSQICSASSREFKPILSFSDFLTFPSNKHRMNHQHSHGWSRVDFMQMSNFQSIGYTFYFRANIMLWL